MGDADITRDQFLASKRVMRKIAQRNTYIVDADFNEQAQISDYRLTEALYNMSVRTPIRFAAGWVMTGGSNQVQVAAGQAIVNINAGQSYVLTLPSVESITGFTTPSGGNRIDIVYLDISLLIYDVGNDPTLINPAVGVECCVDQRLAFTFMKLQGTVGGGAPALPTPAAGHYYVQVAQIARTNGVATINNSDITNAVTLWSPLHSDGHVQLAGSMSVAADITIDGVDLDKSADVLYCQTLQAAYSNGAVITDYGSAYEQCFMSAASGSGVSGTVLKIVAYRRRNYKKIRARMELRQDNSTSGNDVSLTVNALTPAVFHRTSSGGTFESVELEVDVSGVTENAALDILIKMITATPFTGLSGIRKVVIEGVYS